MPAERPNPDALLRDLQRENGRGRLKVFLGASAGVGKTYAMLSEAREQLDRGVDVLLGFIETHGRKETEAQIHGLERLPLREIDYRGVSVTEFDLDAALVRNPALCLVDELAHANAPGSRHAKRWQDVAELLDAGIDVYTAVNVQHLESLNDSVAQITGVIVRETIPDAFLERADEIEVVDVPPDELRQRLQEGKVYVPERIEHALEGFFKTGNLIALREMALRRAAERERRTASLYALSRELARSRGKTEIAAAAAREIANVFETETAVLVLRNGRVDPLVSSTSGFERVASEMAVAQWALEHDEVAGKGTGTLPGASGMYLPLRGANGAVGVVAFLPNGGTWPLPPAQRNLLETFANGLGLALERAQLAKESHEARIAAESERLRNALLSSISHDLRTPLTSIARLHNARIWARNRPEGGAEFLVEFPRPPDQPTVPVG